MNPRVTPSSRDNDAAFIAYQYRLTKRSESALDFLIAVVLVALLLAAVLHFATPCVAGHLC